MPIVRRVRQPSRLRQQRARRRVPSAVTSAVIPFNPAAAVSTTTLTLTAQTQVPLNAAAAVTTTSLALTAATQIPLDVAAAVTTATLAISAQTTIPLNPSSLTLGGSLILFPVTVIPDGTYNFGAFVDRREDQWAEWDPSRVKPKLTRD